MVLITGADQQTMQTAALTLFEAGHIPLIAEWIAPGAGSPSARGPALEELVDPLSERLLLRADSVLRLAASSASADLVVRRARAQGLRVFLTLEDLLAG